MGMIDRDYKKIVYVLPESKAGPKKKFFFGDGAPAYSIRSVSEDLADMLICKTAKKLGCKSDFDNNLFIHPVCGAYLCSVDNSQIIERAHLNGAEMVAGPDIASGEDAMGSNGVYVVNYRDLLKQEAKLNANYDKKHSDYPHRTPDPHAEAYASCSGYEVFSVGNY